MTEMAVQSAEELLEGATAISTFVAEIERVKEICEERQKEIKEEEEQLEKQSETWREETMGTVNCEK